VQAQASGRLGASTVNHSILFCISLSINLAKRSLFDLDKTDTEEYLWKNVSN
jgi:hypothetical protein